MTTTNLSETQVKFLAWLENQSSTELEWVAEAVTTARNNLLLDIKFVAKDSKNSNGQQNKFEPALSDDDLMPFGKHKNKRMQEVPGGYLAWLWHEGCNNLSLKNYIWNSRNDINKEIKHGEQIIYYK